MFFIYNTVDHFILDMSCRSKLATLNEKLTTLERRVEYIEARVGNFYSMNIHEPGELFLICLSFGRL